MQDLFVDCPTGLAGDMLLAALLDLGVPREIVEAPLVSMGLGNSFSLKTQEDRSSGLRGLRVSVDSMELEPPHRRWVDIKEQILLAKLNKPLEKNILLVFESLAKAEAIVHGVLIEQVHFHEIGSMDTLVDIIGVCAAIDYLKPSKIYCTIPPVGGGSVSTSHGLLPVPVPAVLQLAIQHQIKLYAGNDSVVNELTTPTGLALMAILADSFSKPNLLQVHSVGIGLGSHSIGRPNFLRIAKLHESSVYNYQEGLCWQELVYQESWVDDSTPEDISAFIDQLRVAGAIEVTSHPVQMKKNRQGICITAIVKPENAKLLRSVWFSKGITLGLRERIERRCVLPRRIGSCFTSFGQLKAKQIRRPDGTLFVKPEHSELLRISLETGKTFSEIRNEIYLKVEDFVADEDWL